MTEDKRSPLWVAAVAGGVIGSVLTAALLLFAAPQYFSKRIVRQGMMADPQILSDTADALRDTQYAPVLNANRMAIETPFGSSWKGSAKPDVTVVEFFDGDTGRGCGAIHQTGWTALAVRCLEDLAAERKESKTAVNSAVTRA